MTDTTQPRIGFLGAGRMATALATGLLKAFTSSDCLMASDPYASAREQFQQETGAQAVDSNLQVLEFAEVIVVAVKPQVMRTLLEEIAPAVTSEHLFVSIAAGIPLAMMADILGADTRMIRVMPNTPALVSAGAAGYSLGGTATENDGQLVKGMLETVGVALEVPEHLLDVVTGLSGSGPAYVYQMIEALSDGGVRMGLPRTVATTLAAQTLFGAAKMVLETGEHPGALKDAVTSPGGTTIAGIHALESGGLRGTLMDAVQAATLRSQELGKST